MEKKMETTISAGNTGSYLSRRKEDLQPHVARIAIDMRSSEAGLRTSGHGRLDEAIAPGK